MIEVIIELLTYCIEVITDKNAFLIVMSILFLIALIFYFVMGGTWD